MHSPESSMTGAARKVASQDDGTRVIVEVRPHVIDAECEADWFAVGMSRLEEEWNNRGDAIYDDWRALYAR
jgi:hypothetical protein